MEALVLPSTTSYTHGMFAGQAGIQHLVFEGNSPVSISYGAFSGMAELETVVFRCAVQKIVYDCFCRCPELRVVEFQSPIDTIRMAFNSNDKLREVIWPEPEQDLREGPSMSWQRRSPLIGVVDGFNGCIELSPMKAPWGVAEQIAGFSEWEEYHEELIEYALTTGSDSQQSLSVVSPRAERDIILANSFAVMDRTGRAAMDIATRL